MSDRETVDFLAGVDLLEGRDEADLAELARVMARRTIPAGEVVWRQGDEAREVLFVVHGAVTTSLATPGGGRVDIGSAGPGHILGEIGILDGNGTTMGVRVTETATVLALARPDFAALLAGQRPAAFTLRRRLTAHLIARLRQQLAYLAGSLGGEPAQLSAPPLSELERCPPPSSAYVRRMATFHDFDPLALWGFLTSGTYVRCPPGLLLTAEGMPSAAYCLTINGAVEKVLIRGDQRIRVGLAGPGMAFGYESLVDDLPSPLTAVARERTILLMLPRDIFDQLLHRDDAIARVFLEAIQRDLLVTLRQTLRPFARLAASV